MGKDANQITFYFNSDLYIVPKYCFTSGGAAFEILDSSPVQISLFLCSFREILVKLGLAHPRKSWIHIFK